jgi:hypothetical protein
MGGLEFAQALGAQFQTIPFVQIRLKDFAGGLGFLFPAASSHTPMMGTGFAILDAFAT